MKELASVSPTLLALSNIFYIIFIFAVIWILGRMGDNINKIRKILEKELSQKKD